MFTRIINKKVLLFAITLSIINITLAQINKPVTDFISVPGPISFDSKSYVLNWTSHPDANFYKQEYLVKGELAGKFKTMVLIDVITGQQELKDIIAAKLAELKKIKESNPIVNYEIIRNAQTNEYILDFLLTANAPDGSISIIERNVYRYKAFSDKSGKNGIMLFGVSNRAYGAAAADQLLVSLKKIRKDLINKVSQFKMPELKIGN